MSQSSRGLSARLLRPHRFLGFIGLRTGTEIIALSLLFNKVTGVYGLMAILTGYSLSALQLIMYLYSVVTVAILVWMLPRVRKQEPMPTLGLAWLYGIDTIVHTTFIAAFATRWYLDVGPDKSPYSYMENTTSLGLAVAFTMIRIYCALVVAAFARQVLRRQSEGDEEPFAEGTESGEGWKGRAGRAMLAVGRDYWLDADGDDEYDEDWRRSMGYKFVSGGAGPGGPEADVEGGERGDGIDARISTPIR